MENRKEDACVRALGKSILRRLAEAEKEMENLELVCIGHADAIRHCEVSIESVAVDVAAIVTGGGEWDEMVGLIRACGLTVPEELDGDMRRLMVGDDSSMN